MVRGPMIAQVTAGVAQHERDRQLDQGDPGLAGQRCELFSSFKLALVLWQ
jgi:hypothetical protein